VRVTVTLLCQLAASDGREEEEEEVQKKEEFGPYPYSKNDGLKTFTFKSLASTSFQLEVQEV
jgi:hypothetical protein